jgi:hypothetical protein
MRCIHLGLDTASSCGPPSESTSWVCKLLGLGAWRRTFDSWSSTNTLTIRWRRRDTQAAVRQCSKAVGLCAQLQDCMNDLRCWLATVTGRQTLGIVGAQGC